MGRIFSGCPGADRIKQPTIIEKPCPNCGNMIELFSDDVSVACDVCGFVAYNDFQSCIQWCRYAKECIGDELYEKLVTKRENPQK